jgi:FdrA protein
MPVTLEELLQDEPVFVNVGVRDFADSLREAGYEVVDVDWSPPAGGDAQIAALLDELL